MEKNKENNQQLSNQFTPTENNLLLKISKSDFSDSSLGENFFPNKSTKERSNEKNENDKKNYLSNIKEKEVNSLCRKIDFSLELDSNDSKDINIDEITNKVNSPLIPLKEDSNDSIININNKLSSSNEQMEVEEENDLRLIKKQSSKSMLSLKQSKFDEDYIIVKTLSEGENGSIYLCIKIQDNKTYVVKMSTSFTRKIDFNNLKNIINEISKNSKNKFYSYIHQYIDYWIEENNIMNEKTNKRNIYMVSNYCPNDNLIKFIQKIKLCEKNEKEKNNINLNIINKDFYWDIIFQMMISLSFLHQIGYIHLDIKPSNYLVDSKGNLQITDFSLSIKNSEKNNLINLYEYEGDSKYISPEVFYKEKNKISNKTDIFSLGLSIFEILSETDLPLNGKEWQNIRKIGIEKNHQELILKKFGVKDGEIFVNLIKLMTKVDSNSRPDIDSILLDDKNFCKLNKRYILFNKDEFKLSYDINKIPGFVCPEFDFGSNGINNININDLFMKRSDSMKLNNLFEH